MEFSSAHDCISGPDCADRIEHQCAGLEDSLYFQSTYKFSGSVWFNML